MGCFTQILYNEGARTFVVTDAFPAPCYPSHLWKEDPTTLDENGCAGDALKAFQGYNLALATFIKTLNAKLEGANLILFSLHDIIMDGIINPSKYGESLIFRFFVLEDLVWSLFVLDFIPKST